MRLLETGTLELKAFLGDVPPYAILSHTWEDEEVTLQDMMGPRGHASKLKGFAKLVNSAKLAQQQGYGYIWIDTCCIDKTSSADLSEAINSMFQWYRGAGVCYAYLADADADVNLHDSSQWASQHFWNCRWFTRGWTLQELIAPANVIFLARDWTTLGTTESLAGPIEVKTGIPRRVLNGKETLSSISVASKMAWASRRVTTRPEDLAYCLMGLFDVNMPLLYGEGEQKAFLRLQSEFLKISDDETILAWRAEKSEAASKPYWGLLATSPRPFRGSHNIDRPQFKARINLHPIDVTNRGIRIPMRLAPFPGDRSQSVFLAILQCHNRYEGLGCIYATLLQRVSGLEEQYARVCPDLLLEIRDNHFSVPCGSLTAAHRAYVAGTNNNDSLTWDNLTEKAWIAVEAHYMNMDEQLIFVGPVPRASEPIAGMFIYPSVLRRVSPKGWLELVGFDATWSRSDNQDRPSQEVYMVVFDEIDDDDNLRAASLDVTKLERRIVLGCFLVNFHFRTKIAILRDIASFIVVGLEPLPQNPFGTAPAYTRPWFSFANGTDLDDVRKRFNDPEILPDISQTLELPERLCLTVEFSFGSHLSSIFHKMELVIKNYPRV
ncbi:heterokaryon incompatibility protein-domain-containing protein [Lasiosphaeria ovina]|uniref:Heterokaryon incompatibility protein-domain-containing protein n=1 Tax=Lasiosphaeria ovina TaxID=92902 RepID=A0AAE0JSU0_9PEZI|nr:heterokaryon incompatibility protein-domain-containing protein [Lasiosphaeria ovina]